VFAKALEADIANDDHLIVFLGENLSQMGSRIFVKSLEDLSVHPRDPIRRFEEAFAIGIFADRDQDLADRVPDPFEIDAWDGFPDCGVFVKLPVTRLPRHRESIGHGTGLTPVL
jgi:hypothetical protein